MNLKTLLLLLLLLISVACSTEEPAHVMSAGDMGNMPAMQINAAALDTATEKMSDNGLFHISINPLIEPIQINTLHSWQLTLLDKEMQPVEGAAITFGGGMPEHNHGFPTEPQVVAGEQAGEYVIEGVKMQMAGWWEMKLEILVDDETDTVTFNVVLP